MSRVDELFDDALAALDAGHSLPEALAQANGSRAELLQLLVLARDLRGLRAITPRPTWQRAARARVLAAGKRRAIRPAHRTRGCWADRGPFRWLPPWMRRVALAAAVLLAAASTAWGVERAAAGSVPGDALYPMKRSFEALRYGLALTSETKATVALDLADRRLDELRGLADRDGAPPDDAVAAYRAALDRAVEAVEHTGNRDRLTTRLEERLASHEQRLERLRSTPGVQSALEAARAAQQRVSGGSPSEPSAPPNPPPMAPVSRPPFPSPPSVPSDVASPESDPVRPPRGGEPALPRPPARSPTTEPPGIAVTPAAPTTPRRSAPPGLPAADASSEPDRREPRPPADRPGLVAPPIPGPSADWPRERSDQPTNPSDHRPAFPFPIPQVPAASPGPLGRPTDVPRADVPPVAQEGRIGPRGDDGATSPPRPGAVPSVGPVPAGGGAAPPGSTAPGDRHPGPSDRSGAPSGGSSGPGNAAPGGGRR